MDLQAAEKTANDFYLANRGRMSITEMMQEISSLPKEDILPLYAELKGHTSVPKMLYFALVKMERERIRTTFKVRFQKEDKSIGVFYLFAYEAKDIKTAKNVAKEHLKGSNNKLVEVLPYVRPNINK